MNKIESPCVSICVYNINEFCIGCKRTRDEISDWRKYTDDERKHIMSLLDDRNID
jgi:hypothetical protein